jgi:hypothetical protein
LTVKGDGISTLQTLILGNFRAKLVWERLAIAWANQLNDIPAADEVMLLEPIGNHNRGTKFVDSNYLISTDLEAVFTTICQHLPDFNYGRLDLRAASLADFLAGKNIKIMEVNGVNAEPAHIYDPNTSPLNGWATLLKHWTIIYRISMHNINKGVKIMCLEEAIQHYRAWRAAV